MKVLRIFFIFKAKLNIFEILKQSNREFLFQGINYKVHTLWKRPGMYKIY